MVLLNGFVKWEILRKSIIYTAVSPEEFLDDRDLNFLVLNEQQLRFVASGTLAST